MRVLNAYGLVKVFPAGLQPAFPLCHRLEPVVKPSKKLLSRLQPAFLLKRRSPAEAGWWVALHGVHQLKLVAKKDAG